MSRTLYGRNAEGRRKGCIKENEEGERSWVQSHFNKTRLLLYK